MNNKKENVLGIILLVVVILLGVKILPGAPIYFRMFSGLAIGYTLTRAALGFAGGPNRAYRSGSTKLFRGVWFRGQNLYSAISYSILRYCTFLYMTRFRVIFLKIFLIQI